MFHVLRQRNITNIMGNLSSLLSNTPAGKFLNFLSPERRAELALDTLPISGEIRSGSRLVNLLKNPPTVEIRNNLLHYPDFQGYGEDLAFETMGTVPLLGALATIPYAMSRQVKGARNWGKQSGMIGASERMERAKDLGFDINTRYIHESPYQDPISEIKDEGRFGGIFSLPNDRAGYYDNVQEFFLKNEPFNDGDIYRIYEERPRQVKEIIRTEFPNADPDEYIDYVATFDNVPHELIEESYSDLQKVRAKIARLGGAESVTQPDEFGNTVQILGGPGVRDVRAAFSKEKAHTSNLLATGLLGGIGLKHLSDKNHDKSGTDLGHLPQGQIYHSNILTDT